VANMAIGGAQRLVLRIAEMAMEHEVSQIGAFVRSCRTPGKR
jgi:hypothetical protein